MTSGGWYSQDQRHGRHRQGATGAAWTPAVRPTDSTPAHAQHDGVSAFRPADTDWPPAWPASEVLTRRPGWPPDPGVPQAPTPADAPAWPAPRHRTAELRPDLTDTVPIGHGAQRGRVEPSDAESGAVAYALPEMPVTGLRKFDLGTVPASVTPPRSWRRAAWFAVSTSAAVALGLTVATTELMSRPADDGAMIDALPAYPSGPLTLAELPHEATTSAAQAPAEPSGPGDRPSQGDGSPAPSEDSPPRYTVIGDTAGAQTVVPAGPSSEGATSPPTTTPREPTRRTVGPAPVALTDPAKMGDRTEAYFRLVTSDPAAAHAMTTGDMAREGPEGLAARYDGIERIEVQEITIDRNQAITRSKVKVVRKDGTETVEHRQLTFTWDDDPKITDEAVTE